MIYSYHNFAYHSNIYCINKIIIVSFFADYRVRSVMQNIMSFSSNNSGPKCGISFHPSPHKLTGVTTDCISRVRFSPANCPITLLGVTA